MSEVRQKDITERLISLLRELGFKPYEAKAYIALLQLHSATASEIALKTGIPQPRIYDVLNSLVEKGFLEVILTKPRKFRVVKPDLTIPRLARNIMCRIKMLEKDVLEMINYLRRGKAEALKEPYITMIKNQQVVFDKLANLIRTSTIDCVMCLPINLLGKMWDTIISSLKADKSKVLALILYGPEVGKVKISEKLREISEYGNVCIRVRRIPVLPVILADNEVSLILAENYCLEVSEPKLLRLLDDFLYYAVWKVSEIVKDFPLRKGYTFKSSHTWLVTDIIRKALENGFRVRLTVKGIMVKEKKPIEVRGEVANLYFDTRDLKRTIEIRTEDGRIIRVGGLGSVLEDIEGRVYNIEIL